MPTGMQDFAGSTAVHLIGATGAFAALLLLGARRGKYGADGKPRAIPGHSMPLAGLGVLILFIGWFGFNPGSTLNALDGRFPEVAMVTLLGGAGGVARRLRLDPAFPAHDRHRHGCQRHDRRPGRDHGAVGLHRGMAGTDHRLRRGHHRRGRRDLDRQAPRRPCWRALGTRSGGYLGHALVRPLHRATAGAVQRLRRPRGRAALLGPPDAAGRPGPGRAGRLHVRVRDELCDVRAHQGDDRAACGTRARGRRSRHRRARHVWLSGAVHPGARGRIPGRHAWLRRWPRWGTPRPAQSET